MADELALLLPSVVDIARRAGQAIMLHHQNKLARKQFTMKSDQSPVTQADKVANDLIVEGLLALADWPVLAEESTIPAYNMRKLWQRYWLVDPLDGTKEFIAGTDDFTVNIALIDRNQPVLGVILLPVTQTCYTAHREGLALREVMGEESKPVKVCGWDTHRPLQIVASRRHDNKDVNSIMIKGVPCEITRMGSSIKFCRVAEGAADFYPRFGLTSEWDTAAGQCIVERAGGIVTDRDGNRLQYNTKESLLNPHFVVVGDYQRIEPLWR